MSLLVTKYLVDQKLLEFTVCVTLTVYGISVIALKSKKWWVSAFGAITGAIAYGASLPLIAYGISFIPKAPVLHFVAITVMVHIVVTPVLFCSIISPLDSDVEKKQKSLTTRLKFSLMLGLLAVQAINAIVLASQKTDLLYAYHEKVMPVFQTWLGKFFLPAFSVQYSWLDYVVVTVLVLTMFRAKMIASLKLTLDGCIDFSATMFVHVFGTIVEVWEKVKKLAEAPATAEVKAPARRCKAVRKHQGYQSR